MKLTRKFKKMLLLGVLGMTTVILAGIASTKVIQTEITKQSEREVASEGYMLETSADTLESEEKQELNNSQEQEIAVSETHEENRSSFVTKPDLATRK